MSHSVNRSKILFPQIHIKLGLIRQFVKALDKDGDTYKYICRLTIEKFDQFDYRKIKGWYF